MKILTKNLNQGLIKVLVESADDLWYLDEIIEPEDECKARTIRKLKVGNENNPKTINKTIILTIKVEKTEFHESTGNLRVSGKITDGPDDLPRGNYHSFNLNPGKDITIIKDEWPSYLLNKIKESQKAASRYLITIFDREKAIFAELKKRKYNIISSLNIDAQSKNMPKARSEDIYKKIVESIKKYYKHKNYDGIIIGSANFWRKYIKKEIPENLKSKIVYANVSSVDESTINELVKRPELKNLLEEERMVKELSFIDRVKEAIAKDNACYSVEDCKKNISEGNIKLLLVSNNLIKKLRSEDKFYVVKKLMKSAEKMNAELHIISSEKATKQLDSLSGIAGICRW